MEVGAGRTRFLALWGVMLSATFAVATAMTALATFLNRNQGRGLQALAIWRRPARVAWHGRGLRGDVEVGPQHEPDAGQLTRRGPG